MKRVTIFLLVIALSVMTSITLNAATDYATNSGNWHSASTWHANKIPVKGDSLIIGGGYTVTVTVNDTCATLTVGKTANPASGNGTIVINAGVVLTVTGNVKMGDGAGIGTISFQTAGSGELNMTNNAAWISFPNGSFSGASVIRRAISGGGIWAFTDVNTRLVTDVGQGAISVVMKTYPSTNVPVGDTTKAIRRYLSITPSGALTATLRFSYTDAELKSLTEANLKVWRYNGTAWVNAGGTVAPASNYVEITGVSTWSDWTACDPSNPLPVQMASFNAHLNNLNATPSVQLDWMTVSEINNYGFYVQRQLNGETDFTTLENSFVAGNGTTLEQHNYSWTDANVPAGTHSYRIKQVDMDGLESFTPPIDVTIEKTTGVKEETIPIAFKLNQNYPNPFNPTTTISFNVAESNPTTLKVYNLMGEEIATLFNGVASSGKLYTFNFDASKLGNGIYYYRVQSGMNTEVRKMTLLK